MLFNIYYISVEENATVCFTDTPRDEVPAVVGRILDAGLEITGIISSDEDY